MFFKKFFSISRIIFLHWKRNKIFFGFLIAGVVFIFLSVVSTMLGPRIKYRILIDTGMFSIEFISIISIIFISSTTLIKLIDTKSIYFYLSKPFSRLDFFIGVYAGICNVFILLFGALVILYTFFLFISGIDINLSIVILFYYMFLKLLLILSVGYFFSSYSTSMISSILLTITTVIIGYMTQGIDYYIQISNAGIFRRIIYRLLQTIFPYMDYYNISDYILEIGTDKIFIHTLGISLYTIGYILFLIGISSYIFKRRDL